MAELLSPGVVIEEVASKVNIINAVSTSTLGIVGWTPKGPSNIATFVSSYDQFANQFGSFDTRDLTAYSLAAFFANGGRRAYVTRVTPSDATAAVDKIQSNTTDQQIEIGNGATTVFTKDMTTSLLKDNTGASPILGGSISVRWRAAGVAVVAQQLKKRDGVTALAGVTAQNNYEGRIIPGSLPTFDYKLYSVVPGITVTLAWTSGGAQTQILTAPTAGNYETTTVGTNVTVRFDWKTGVISMKFTSLPPDNATAINLSYTPAGATITQTLLAGSGNPPTTGLYDPTNGSYTLTAGTAPHNLSPVLATYTIAAWTLAPISKGIWANSLAVITKGSTDFFTTLTNTYSRYNVTVQSTDATTGIVTVLETYESLDFNTPSSTAFGPDIINSLSSYITYSVTGGYEGPLQLSGIGRSLAIGGGNELTTTPELTYTTTLGNTPIQPRTVVITYTDAAGVARKIVDDGNGALIDSIALSIDSNYTAGNTINYTTGAIDFRVPVSAVRGGTLVDVAYSTTAAALFTKETFGDTTKGYTAGTDGTFDSINFGRNQFSSPTLSATYQGLYAFDRVDEILQVIIPYFSGDTVVTGDLLDYAATRAASSAGGDRFIILTTPVGKSPQKAVDYFRYTLARYSDYAAMYWPWIKISDPLSTNKTKLVPPTGHVAGIYSRTDNDRNVGKAPAGTVDGQLNFLTGLEYVTTQGERDLVYPNRINPLISSTQTGNAVWGAQTISNQSQWRNINARRLFMFVEKSVYNATFWIVFENNGPALWTRITAQLNGFLTNLFNDGYFAGSSPQQAFFVTCDETNNTAASINAGQVIVDVGIAPNQPAIFVRFRFAQLAAS